VGQRTGPGSRPARPGLPDRTTLGPLSRRCWSRPGYSLASRWRTGGRSPLDSSSRPAWAAAIVADIELPAPFGSSVFVHYKPTHHIGYARERELQAVRCARFVDEVTAGRDVHVVLLGDFDDTPDSSSVRFWTGRQSLDGFSVAYRDAWEAVHPDDPARRSHRPIRSSEPERCRWNSAAGSTTS
jgi:hypothetical protein